MMSAINECNKPGSEKFIFLLKTRAGGLSINFTTADIVVFMKVIGILGKSARSS